MSDKIKNFLKKNIHQETIDSVLLICAPVNDDADYEWITEAGVHNALRPFSKWFDEMEGDYQYEMNWGSPWDEHVAKSFGGEQLFINVVAKANMHTKAWTAEDLMMFKLKFNDLPITNLGPYIEEALKDQQ